MKKTGILSLLFISLFTAAAFGETSIKAEVDKTSLTADDSFTYKLTITSSEENMPAPALSKFTGFKILSSAQSSTMSVIKNNIKTIIAYTFILAPANIGRFNIEASTIKIKKETYSTPAFVIEVKPGKTRPKAKPKEKPLLPEEIQPETEEPQITL